MKRTWGGLVAAVAIAAVFTASLFAFPFLQGRYPEQAD